MRKASRCGYPNVFGEKRRLPRQKSALPRNDLRNCPCEPVTDATGSQSLHIFLDKRKIIL